VHLVQILKNAVITSDLIFFQNFGIFPMCFGCILPANATNKESLNYKNLTNHFFAIIKVSRPETIETETRPETFKTKTETRKNGSWDESRDESRDRDQVSRLHHWPLQRKTATRTPKSKPRHVSRVIKDPKSNMRRHAWLTNINESVCFFDWFSPCFADLRGNKWNETLAER